MSFGKLLDDLDSALGEARHASARVEKIVSEIRTRLRALNVAFGPISEELTASFGTVADVTAEPTGAPNPAAKLFNVNGSLKTGTYVCPFCGKAFERHRNRPGARQRRSSNFLLVRHISRMRVLENEQGKHGLFVSRRPENRKRKVNGETPEPKA